MLYAPLVMPEVITGLSLLLLFVAIDAERGFWTVTIAHTTLTMCFVAVVVQSRLERARSQSGGSRDGSRLRAGAGVLRGDAAADPAGDCRGLDAGLHVVAGRSGDRELHHRPGRATLPIRIYSEVRLGVKPEINAICTLSSRPWRW